MIPAVRSRALHFLAGWFVCYWTSQLQLEGFAPARTTEIVSTAHEQIVSSAHRALLRHKRENTDDNFAKVAQTSFEKDDHTDLYTARQARDNAWRESRATSSSSSSSSVSSQTGGSVSGSGEE
eukprot:CAMPEP_0197861488 /NCGR_PEP_ID=MMETSP1438-20131217/37584_1 /TAXON_ID=1461541 /ORGANISM="Pterosperma sp., Strain CCMP1384" /LENGTH=122 /DNA_ID=CAMNT_0043478683 /DNA_START=271 /DNA_END=636 /DNA_ORIENTATION=+